MHTKARRDDPETSHEAARDAEPKAQTQRNAVLAEVIRQPGQTAVEIARSIDMDRYAVSRRLPELRDGGLVGTGVIRRCRVNRSNMLTWWPPKPAGQSSLF